mmetsp:Transcript_78750/g.159850  ORF Transcript_78750/g.159850 Transcript_78750/m.159850 type:complete len:100 (-) Transcript_78750:41-340(-)
MRINDSTLSLVENMQLIIAMPLNHLWKDWKEVDTNQYQFLVVGASLWTRKHELYQYMGTVMVLGWQIMPFQNPSLIRIRNGRTSKSLGPMKAIRFYQSS